MNKHKYMATLKAPSS